MQLARGNCTEVENAILIHTSAQKLLLILMVTGPRMPTALFVFKAALLFKMSLPYVYLHLFIAMTTSLVCNMFFNPNFPNSVHFRQRNAKLKIIFLVIFISFPKLGTFSSKKCQIIHNSSYLHLLIAVTTSLVCYKFLKPNFPNSVHFRQINTKL